MHNGRTATGHPQPHFPSQWKRSQVMGGPHSHRPAAGAAARIILLLWQPSSRKWKELFLAWVYIRWTDDDVTTIRGRQKERKNSPLPSTLGGAWFFYVLYSKKHQCCVLKNGGVIQTLGLNKQHLGLPRSCKAIRHHSEEMQAAAQNWIPGTHWTGPALARHLSKPACRTPSAGHPLISTLYTHVRVPNPKTRIELTLKSA